MNKIEFGDCRETMRRWAQEGIKAQTCVTSPPYYGLRDYGTAKWSGGDESCDHVQSENKHGGQRADRNQEGYKKLFKSVCGKCNAVREDMQIGQEETPEQYIANMVEVFRCVRDVLADDGTLWINIGDSYSVQHVGRRDHGTGAPTSRLGPNKDGLPGGTEIKATGNRLVPGLKPKDLIGIPWMLAFALRADGWYLRQDIIWHKPNPMPESVQDRCTKAHEYIFLLSKSQKYYYDIESIQEPAIYAGDDRGSRGDSRRGTEANSMSGKTGEFRNKRSVWTVTTKPYEGAHFAVFPQDLIEPCIMAGAPVGGVVLDPFMGSGTTAQVAQNLGRKYLGCELNFEYKPLQDKRLRQMSLELV